MSIQRYRTNHISGDYYPEDGGELVLYADHVAAVEAAVKKAMDSARARLLMVPSTRCHPENPNIEMVEQEEAYCAVLDVLPIGIPGYSHPKDAMKAVRDDERARIRAAVEAAWKAGFAPVMNFGLRGDPKPYPLEPSCYECNGEQYGADAAMDVVLAIIDGDADA